MKILMIVILLVLCETRLDYNGTDCTVYTQKFITKPPNSISFTGQTALSSDSQGLTVKLRYTDPKFEDPIFFGLTQEDGKTADDTCLDLKLWKFPNAAFNNTEASNIIDLPLIPSSNLENHWRYLQFTIKKNDFSTRLIQASNSDQYIYIGYYNISYSIAEHVQYSYKFKFSVTVNKYNQDFISTNFKGYLPITSELKWCSDATCIDNTAPDLHLNDQFYILQIVNQNNLNTYTLVHSTVSLVGDGLDVQVQPLSVDNSKPGQVILLLPANIAWSNLSLYVVSYLQDQSGKRLLKQEDTFEDSFQLGRLLETTSMILDPISGKPLSISCIKVGSTCPTCGDQCKANHYAQNGCSKCEGRISFDSQSCQNYLKKLQIVNQLTTSVSFTGKTTLSSDLQKVIITLQYTDSLFNDAEYFGLTQEDGKTKIQTCLDLKLWKFTSSSYQNPEQITDLPFTASQNEKNKLRYLSFTIPLSEISTRLIRSDNSNQNLYNGYYAIAYYEGDTTNIQYIFFFQFTIILQNQAIKKTFFIPLNHQETYDFKNRGPVKNLAQINWCADAACSMKLQPNLYLYRQFYIQQLVVSSSPIYLIDTEVYFVGDGLRYQTKPLLIDNSQPGQVILLLIADIVWTNFQIQVISYLASSLSTGFTKYDPVQGITNQISCIIMNQNDTTCPTCADECKANGFARPQCSQCRNRLDFHSEACHNYLNKIFKADFVTSLSFTGEAIFIPGSSQLSIYLTYFDPLFDDPQYYGLSQEDGKTPEQTCLDLKIWKFTNISYEDPEEITDLSISASSNSIQKLRNLIFIINGSDFPNKLIGTSNSNHYVYNGYYALTYSAAGTQSTQFKFLFQFSVTIFRQNGTIISTTFIPLNPWETLGCAFTRECILQYSSELKWCSDENCTNDTTPNLYLNGSFYIQQIVKVPTLNKYQLINTVVYFIAYGLSVEIKPLEINNSKLGQVMLLLPANILWSNFSIHVVSYLQTDKLLFPVSGSIDKVQCIKRYSDFITCPTCTDECNINHFSRNECNQCHSRLPLDSEACNMYLQKFSLNNITNQAPLSFTGNILITQDVVVSLRYIDNTTTLWGLSQEDGKKPEETCLDLRLWKFNRNFTNSVETTSDFIIKGSENNKVRYLNFSIKESDFTTRLHKSDNTDYIIYQGNYAIGYYLAETDIDVYAFYFSFSITVSQINNTINSTSFTPFNQLETQKCSISGTCVVSPSTTLKWCSSPTCSNNTVPNLHFKDQFYIQQTVNQEDLKQFYLVDTVVYYVGNGLNLETKPLQINNSSPGKAILLLSANILWSNVSIHITSYLSTTPQGTRLQEQNELITHSIQDPVFGKTEPIECIKLVETECPSCKDQCRENGFVNQECDLDPTYNIYCTILNIVIIFYLII